MISSGDENFTDEGSFTISALVRGTSTGSTSPPHFSLQHPDLRKTLTFCFFEVMIVIVSMF